MTIWQTIKKNPAVLTWAIIIHLLAFIAIGVSFKASEPKISEVQKEKVIEAVVIDESKINEEINKLKKAEQRKKSEQKKLQKNAEKAKKDRRKEEKKLQALKKKQKEQEKISKEKRAKEQKHLAELEKQRKESEKKRLETEQKLNQLEKQRLQKQAQLEKQRLEKQAQLEKEEQQRQQEIARVKRLEAQKKQAKYEQDEVAKFKGLIRNEITRNWIFPASYQKGMTCKVLVRLIPSGDVISVRIIQTSGNSAFDRSVEMAVQKASPLPVPNPESGLFDYFREVEFVFDPNA